MQYQDAKTELQSPPHHISFTVMLFEAATMMAIAVLLSWLV